MIKLWEGALLHEQEAGEWVKMVKYITSGCIIAEEPFGAKEGAMELVGHRFHQRLLSWQRLLKKVIWLSDNEQQSQSNNICWQPAW